MINPMRLLSIAILWYKKQLSRNKLIFYTSTPKNLNRLPNPVQTLIIKIQYRPFLGLHFHATVFFPLDVKSSYS